MEVTYKNFHFFELRLFPPNAAPKNAQNQSSPEEAASLHSDRSAGIAILINHRIAIEIPSERFTVYLIV